MKLRLIRNRGLELRDTEFLAERVSGYLKKEHIKAFEDAGARAELKSPLMRMMQSKLKKDQITEVFFTRTSFYDAKDFKGCQMEPR